MTLVKDQPVQPWGLGRMTPTSPAVSEFQTVVFDPETQLTHFYDANGAIVDMATSTVTKSKGGGGDGSSGATEVTDDTKPDDG